ncbi:MAG: U32 family peptidase, partial [Solobacterium sp.]|nr:U32 family peptidase [Solobacterium sp.]
IIKTHPDNEFEVFFMRNGCILSDAHCLGMHRPECGATCAMLRYKQEQIVSDCTSFQDKHDIDVNSYLYNGMLLTHACALCAVYRLQKMGVRTLKIVGRSDDADQVEEDVRLSKRNLDIAVQCSSEEEYLENMIFPPYAPQVCRLGMSCYYPEVRFGKE